MSTELRAVITGAGSGLGRALAVDIGRRGGRVVCADINDAGITETALMVKEVGGEAHQVHCDVTDAAQVEDLAAQATALLGAVDLVANNAGVAAGGPFEDIPLDNWQWVVNVNLWGVIHGCRAFLPAMRARGHGYVLNVASSAGLVSFPEVSPYNVTKAGVVALSETLHGEYTRHGVNVSVLCPTFFVTNIVKNARSSGDRDNASAMEQLMRGAEVQAPAVARIAVDATLAGMLYVLPMSDGRFMWRMQRAMPQRFYRWLASGNARELLRRRRNASGS